jgi:hypothetical protein
VDATNIREWHFHTQHVRAYANAKEWGHSLQVGWWLTQQSTLISPKVMIRNSWIIRSNCYWNEIDRIFRSSCSHGDKVCSLVHPDQIGTLYPCFITFITNALCQSAFAFHDCHAILMNAA